LLGDLLISAVAAPGKYQFSLPVQDVEYFGDAPCTITGLTQKVSIVAPNLAVGWAGTKIVAKTIILEMLRRFTSDHPATYDKLGKFFSELDFPEATGVQMVGLVLEDQNTVRDFRVNAKAHKTALLGDIQLGGSGCNHFLQVLQNFSSFNIGGNPPEFVAAVRKLLSVACSILGEELNTRSNLSGFYGGGFEIAYFNQGRFEKLGDITYFFLGC
jgi:hypothetical protein